MKNMVQKAYYICAGVTLLFFVFILFAVRLDIYDERESKGFEILEEYQVVARNVNGTPAGIVQNYLFQIDNIDGAYSTLMFYTYHQNVEVFVDDERIYRMKPNASNVFGKTPGCVWNDVQLDEDDIGKQIRVRIIPVYEKSVDRNLTFYFGERYSIAQTILASGAPAMLMGCISIVIGLIFIVFCVYNYSNSEVDKNLLMLGIFSLLVGIWEGSDCAAFKFIVRDCPAISYLPFLALALIPIPFVLYLKELNNNREHFAWYIPCYASIAVIAINVVCQYLGIFDVREMLPLTQGTLLLVVVVSVVMVALEYFKMGWSKRLRRNVYCMLFCFFGLLFDLFIYYGTDGKSEMILGMAGFMVYIVVLGIASIRDAKQLMTIGMRAKNFEQLAFHDQLTGLYNRRAYAAHISSEEFVPERCIVAMLDLNELKQCNDKLGHEKGDVYIKESARIIYESFGNLGECYRMGGDEFCVLMPNCTLESCRKQVRYLLEQVDRFNSKSKDVHMGIACGYEMYDKRIDYDISDTARRADKMMYHEKFAMKHDVAAKA